MRMTPNEFRESFKGVIDLVLTPFDKNDQIDEEALRAQLSYVKSHFKGEDLVFLAGGSTAEFYAMNDEEWIRYIKIVVDEVNGEFPVLAGAGRAGTKYTIEMCKEAEKIGADAVMIINPYYHLVSEDGIYRHIKAIAEEVNIGIVTYNNPFTSKLWIPPALMAKIAKIKNVVGNKENTPNPMAFYKMQQLIDPEDMVIICGLGFDMFQFVSMYGCPGYITEMGAYAPELAIQIYKAGRQRDSVKMAKLIDKAILMFDFVAKVAKNRAPIPTLVAPQTVAYGQPVYQCIHKKAIELIGLPSGRTREPMEDNLTLEEINELREILITMGCKVIK
jgi:4-hydroxy-tetrahydrodipicolinate synthase